MLVCVFVCCVYYKGSAAQVLLVQCHSCNRTLSDVVCSEDANDQGEGDGCNEFHGRMGNVV